MPRAISSVRSHRDIPVQSPRERPGRISRDEQLAALDAAFKRIWLEPDSNSVSSSNVTDASPVNRTSGRRTYEPSEISEVSDQSTVCWSDDEGSTVTSSIRRPARLTSTNVTHVSTATWSSGRHLPPSYEPSDDSDVSDQSTVCWSDHEDSTTASNSRRPPVIADRSNAGPAPLLRETFLPISDINDFSAVQIIMALLHDCLLAINKLLLGRRPPEVFSHRYHLLSLYIVKDDVRAFRKPLQLQGLNLRYSVIKKLLHLRQKTLFATEEELNHYFSPNGRGRSEFNAVRDIIDHLRQEPLGNTYSDDERVSFQVLIGKIDYCWDERIRLSEWIDIISKDIRSFLDIRPFRDVAPFDTFTEVTPAREVAMLHDIFFGLWAIHTKAFSGPSDTQFISLTDDCRRTPYSDSRRMRHIHHLVLCRDVLCGVLPGPSPLTMRSAYNTYLRPVLSVSRQHFSFWARLPSLESAKLENYFKTFFVEAYEERMDSYKDFQLMALQTMMDHFPNLYKRYFSRRYIG